MPIVLFLMSLSFVAYPSANLRLDHLKPGTTFTVINSDITVPAKQKDVAFFDGQVYSSAKKLKNYWGNSSYSYCVLTLNGEKAPEVDVKIPVGKELKLTKVEEKFIGVSRAQYQHEQNQCDNNVKYRRYYTPCRVSLPYSRRATTMYFQNDKFVKSIECRTPSYYAWNTDRYGRQLRARYFSYYTFVSHVRNLLEVTQVKK